MREADPEVKALRAAIEPDAQTAYDYTSAEMFMASAAISLKRIADALEKKGKE